MSTIFNRHCGAWAVLQTPLIVTDSSKSFKCHKNQTMSHVTYHLRPATCQILVSHVILMSHIVYFVCFFWDKVVKLIGGGSLINGGPTPSSLYIN